MTWDLAIAAVAKLLETSLQKIWPSGAEKSKRLRIAAEERFKKRLKESDQAAAERLSTPSDGQ